MPAQARRNYSQRARYAYYYPRQHRTGIINLPGRRLAQGSVNDATSLVERSRPRDRQTFHRTPHLSLNPRLDAVQEPRERDPLLSHEGNPERRTLRYPSVAELLRVRVRQLRAQNHVVVIVAAGLERIAQRAATLQ